MYSYSQLQDIKNRVVRDVAAEQGKATTARGAFTQIKDALATMQSQYAGWVGEVNDYLAANPSDPAAVALNAEKDALVAEFASLSAVVTALETAVDGV